MGNVEIPQWLKGLPLAPEYRPTDTEFADPIAYISKIEKEASAYGICKIIPPLPKPSKKYVFNNLNKSLSRTRELGLDVNFPEAGDLSKRVSQDKRNDNETRAVFTTRQQELGQDAKRSRGAADALQPVVQKQVWQSGEFYTLEQFESKSKAFSRSVLGMIKEVTPLVIEALFWKATSEKPIYVEYANDVPGSGFGEPEGLLRYSCARKKKRRVCAQSQGGESDTHWAQPGVNDARSLCTGVEVEALGLTPSPIADLAKECIDSPTSSSNETSLSAKQNGLCANAELAGTAGWKLSNCPWNLQVIARSAGSLTRFMLDDIPGVTSPMVYIGMLFSWFAWHVEDHELHSLNFLHTGSPKTWYAVPGEYAFAFEDVIRKQAYGGYVDHLAALKRLGEKTTLLSPEMVAASGIPCCRLVQNPGEFVVTFPRAYHVGFSHGFNCGEAANFGTPQWLTIAKEAAVRRAAMDHLPMLSHQQLLYLLTMSFIPRVPRTLLPSARNSRLKNRLKDERELLVKKAFIEDVLKENHLVNTLLGKNSEFRAVLWHPDSLPSLARDSLSWPRTILDAELSVPLHKGTNQDIHHLISCGKTLNDLYMDSNDLLCDFQVDSGTLVCVACGILGYPIMSVVQPSKKASMHKFSVENISITGAVDIPHQPDLCTKIGFSETKNYGTWDTSRFLRPRLFCMEHAVQIEELLRPKGGAKMLVICHHDYQKIKANATAIAEELKSAFNYKEVQLDSASKEELNVIDMAIDNEQLTDFHEDWTSKLGINLRVSVKTRKGCLPKKIEHALNIDYLLSLMCPVSRISNVKWCSRKSRTKREPNHKILANCCDGNLYKKDEMIHESNSMEIKGKVLLQYYRKKYRAKSRNITRTIFTPGCGVTCSGEVADADCGKINDSNEQDNTRTLTFKKAEADSVEFDTPEKYFVVHEEAVAPEANMDSASNKSSDMVVLTKALTSTSSFLNLLRTVGVGEESTKANEDLHVEICLSTPDVAMRDTGKASSARKKMRGESDLTITYRPEELEGESAGSLVLGKTRFRHEDALAAFSVTENLGEIETCKPDGFSTCTESTITVELDMPVLPNDSLNKRSQTGVQASSLSNKWEEKGKNLANPKITPADRSKGIRIVELQTEAQNNFIRSPCEGLRPRKNKEDSIHTVESECPEVAEEKPPIKKHKKSLGSSVSCNRVLDDKTTYRCNLEGCRLRFRTRSELSLHRHNKCHHKECGKKFRSHKYVVLHQRVHNDERPLKCTWTGCTMTFKWAWARTEHLRLHTGERPYQCKIKGCGLTFRFVSDFSRHRRKTGHHANQPPK